MPPRRLAALLVPLVCALPFARAQLAQRSPFMPGDNETATAAATPVFEFWGYIKSSDGVRFRVNDTARKTGAWVRLNEPNEMLGIVARGHDAGHELLFVEHEGRALTLPMHRAKIMHSGAPTALLPRPVMNGSNVSASADLDQLTQAIAQRRAARAQSAAK